MDVSQYKEIKRGFLVGKFNLRLTEFNNLIIREMTYFVKGESRWVGFPQREYDKDGEKRYFPYLAFANPPDFENFKNETLQALDRYFAANSAPIPYPATGQALATAAPAPKPMQEELPF